MKNNHLIFILTILLSISSCATNNSTSTYSGFSSVQESSIGEGSNSNSSEEVIVWGDVTYSWNDDHSALTASRKNNKEEIETETVETMSNIVTNATCTEDGIKRYTSNAFLNPAFEVQTYDEIISILGHDYASVVSIDDDHHKHLCSRCDHEEIEAHSYDTGVIQTYAQIVNEKLVLGDILYTCSECGHQKMGKHNHTEFEL